MIRIDKHNSKKCKGKSDKKEWTDDNNPPDPDPIPVEKVKIT